MRKLASEVGRPTSRRVLSGQPIYVPPCLDYVDAGDEVAVLFHRFRVASGGIFLLVGLCLLLKTRRYKLAVRSSASFWGASRVHFWVSSALAAFIEGLLSFDVGRLTGVLDPTASSLLKVFSTSLVLTSYIYLLTSLTSISRGKERPLWVSQHRLKVSTLLFLSQLALASLGRLDETPSHCWWLAVARVQSLALVGLYGAALLATQKSKIISELLRNTAVTSPRAITEVSSQRSPDKLLQAAGLSIIRSFTSSAVAPMGHEAPVSPTSPIEPPSLRLQHTMRASPLLRGFVYRLRALEVLLLGSFVLGTTRAGLLGYLACSVNPATPKLIKAQLASLFIDKIHMLGLLAMAIFAYRDQDQSFHARHRRRRTKTPTSTTMTFRNSHTGSPASNRRSSNSASILVNSIKGGALVLELDDCCEAPPQLNETEVVDDDDDRANSSAGDPADDGSLIFTKTMQ